MTPRGDEGLEPSRKNTAKTSFSEIGGHPGGQFATFDADIQTVIDAWPVLSDAARKKILKTIRLDVTEQ